MHCSQKNEDPNCTIRDRQTELTGRGRGATGADVGIGAGPGAGV